MMPFLSKISGDFDGLLGIFFGQDGVTIGNQAYDLGLTRKYKWAGDGAIAESTNLAALGKKIEGFVGINRYVPVLDAPLNTEAHKKFFDEAVARLKQVDPSGPLPDRYVQSNFEAMNALNGVTMEIARDQVRAVIGPNGAGKSTFFNCLTGVLRPTSGRILLEGADIAGLSPDQISQKGIARSYQITNLLPNASALENVRIAAQSRQHGWRMLSHHRALRDIIEKAEAMLEAVGLLSKASELAANLSHGEQRTLEIAIALATEPRLLCLDEPTAGMSSAETRDTVDLIRRISEGLAILIVEHDMDVVMELAQRITV